MVGGRGGWGWLWDRSGRRAGGRGGGGRPGDTGSRSGGAGRGLGQLAGPRVFADSPDRAPGREACAPRERDVTATPAPAPARPRPGICRGARWAVDCPPARVSLCVARTLHAGARALPVPRLLPGSDGMSAAGEQGRPRAAPGPPRAPSGTGSRPELSAELNREPSRRPLLVPFQELVLPRVGLPSPDSVFAQAPGPEGGPCGPAGNEAASAWTRRGVVRRCPFRVAASS